MKARIVPQCGYHERLCESHPYLDVWSKSFEEYTSVVSKVRHKLGFVERASVSLEETLWKIPLVQCNDRLYACFDQLRNEIDIVVQPFFIDRVASPAERNDSGPEGKLSMIVRILQDCEIWQSGTHQDTENL